MDATGKVPTGLLQGNLNWLGSFSECLAIRANGQDEQEAFRGQYCTLTFENTGSSTLGTTVSDPNEKASGNLKTIRYELVFIVKMAA